MQPYPSLKNPNGYNLTIDSLRGARLFGCKGCGNDKANNIAEAYHDFYKLANQLTVYNKVDWADQVSTCQYASFLFITHYSVAAYMPRELAYLFTLSVSISRFHIKVDRVLTTENIHQRSLNI